MTECLKCTKGKKVPLIQNEKPTTPTATDIPIKNSIKGFN